MAATTPGTPEGEDCCYEGAFCYHQAGPACGRPLLAAGRPRQASLRRGPGW